MSDHTPPAVVLQQTIKMGKSKAKPVMEEKHAEAAAPSRKHKIPTEQEVLEALNAPPSPVSAPASNLHTIFYFFSALAIGLMGVLVKDAYFIRNKLGKQYALPWQNPVLDRVLVLSLVLVAFALTMFLFERDMLVAKLKYHYRAMRSEYIAWWKATWRTRHRLAFQYAVLLCQLAVAACAWRLLLIATQSDSPIVVVLSGSMETAFYRGDILFLTNYASDAIEPGEIVVFRIDGRDIPIVHRMMQVHTAASSFPHTNDNQTLFLTKGDNNNGHDRPLYARGQLWLLRHEIMGRARFFIPYLGMITVKVNEYPILKFLLVGVMFLLTLYTREL